MNEISSTEDDDQRKKSLLNIDSDINVKSREQKREIEKLLKCLVKKYKSNPSDLICLIILFSY